MGRCPHLAGRVESGEEMKDIKNISERDVAIALVIMFAESTLSSFSLMNFYDNDMEFISKLADKLDVINDDKYLNKLRRVVRRLVSYNVLRSVMAKTQKDYLGEPAKQKEYSFFDPLKAVPRLTTGKSDYYMGPAAEAEWLLRRAYPKIEGNYDTRRL